MCAAVRQWKQRRWSNTNASTSGKTTGSIFTTALGSEKKQKLVVGEERRRGGRRRRTISGAVKASGEERQHRLHTGKKKKGTRAGIVCCGVNGANTAGSAPDSSHGSAHVDEEERASRRVVVTGMGVVSSLGHDPETMYASMLQGTSGISMIEKFDASELPTRFAGEVRTHTTHTHTQRERERERERETSLSVPDTCTYTERLILSYSDISLQRDSKIQRDMYIDICT